MDAELESILRDCRIKVITREGESHNNCSESRFALQVVLGTAYSQTSGGCRHNPGCYKLMCMHGVLYKTLLASAATSPSTSPSWPLPCLAGAPHFVKDLASVSAGQAKTIVVLNPDKAVVSTNILSLVACLHVPCGSVPCSRQLMLFCMPH